MDAISTGLDSATTFDIVCALSEMTHIMGNTFCVSLLQVKYISQFNNSIHLLNSCIVSFL